MLKTIPHNIHEDFLLITACVTYEPKTMHIQLEVIIQDIQDATSEYLVKIPTLNTNILGCTSGVSTFISPFSFPLISLCIDTTAEFLLGWKF